MKRCIASLGGMLLIVLGVYSQSAKGQKLLLVCGDSKVLLVDYQESLDTIPEIVWTWDARLAKDLPDDYRQNKFNSVDDCKSVNNGKQLLVSSSSGAVAILDTETRKVVFYASVPNAHSVEIVPNNRVVAAASTHAEGNKVMVFDIQNPEEPLFTDSLYSAHGVVWHPSRESLFSLGYDVLREYKLVSDGMELKEAWKIPGIGGHDLLSSPDGKSLFMTEYTGAWKFDLENYSFTKLQGFPEAENIKSLGQDHSGQYIFTIPEKSWWTYHVSFFQPERRLSFPDMRVYKARWFNNE